jgi:hypothetical protein
MRVHPGSPSYGRTPNDIALKHTNLTGAEYSSSTYAAAPPRQRRATPTPPYCHMPSTEALVGGAASADSAPPLGTESSHGTTTLALGKKLLLSIGPKELHINGSVFAGGSQGKGPRF